MNGLNLLVVAAMLCAVFWGRALAQLGPPPEVYAPPIPKESIEKAVPTQPSNFVVSVEVTAPQAIQDSLNSALLLELRKRPDVVIPETSIPDYKWSLVCVTTNGGLFACSSVGIQNLKLAQVERYFPELAKYGVWWTMRALTEKGDAGYVAYHGVLTGGASEISQFAMRAVAAFEMNTLEKARKTRADFSRK